MTSYKVGQRVISQMCTKNRPHEPPAVCTVLSRFAGTVAPLQDMHGADDKWFDPPHPVTPRDKHGYYMLSVHSHEPGQLRVIFSHESEIRPVDGYSVPRPAPMVRRRYRRTLAVAA